MLDFIIEYLPTPVVSPTSRFANVLCRSAKKRNERCACICFVLSARVQNSAMRMCIPRSFSHWSGEGSWGTDPHVRETTSEVGEQDFGETTRRRNDSKPNTCNANGLL